MRWATLALLTLLCACNDLRDFRGGWAGPRVGEVPVLHVGAGSRATLQIDSIDEHGIAGRLAVEGLAPATSFESMPGVEADALANLTFAGNPLRVYFGFIGVPGEPAVILIALFDDRRIEVRLLREGSSPLYAIFALTEAAA